MEFQYYVVEFLTPVHATVPRFVCIPRSWIRSSITDKKAAVSFPNEEYLATVEKIVLGQTYAQDWTIQMAEIKFGCDSLNEAQRHALEQCIGTPAIHVEKNNQETPSPNKGATKSKSTDGKTPQKAKKRNAKIQDDETPAKYVKSDKCPKIKEIKQTNEEKTKKPNRTQTIQREKNDRGKKILKKLAQVFETTEESFDEITDTLNRMQEIVYVIKKNLNKTADMIKNHDNNDNTNQCTEPVFEIASKRGTRNSEDLPNSFVFPDDSNKESKWTLRHQKVTNGLMELLLRSGVYVRVSELEKLDTDADSPNQAALMLLKEIFSDDALSKCSLTGRGSRPPLDKYSRQVLIMYLNEYCNKRRWKTDEPSVWNFLRSKLPEFRPNEEARN